MAPELGQLSQQQQSCVGGPPQPLLAEPRRADGDITQQLVTPPRFQYPISALSEACFTGELDRTLAQFWQL